MTGAPSSSGILRTPGHLRQRGAMSLFVTLVLLVIVMMLGITGAMMGNSQFRIAGNLQYENVAFNLAETAAAAAQLSTNFNDSGFTTYNASGKAYLYPIADPPVDPFGLGWTNSDSFAVGGNDNERYVVQRIATNIRYPDDVMTGSHQTSCNRQDVFRITARGVAATGTVKFVQTTFSAPTPSPRC